ncbi:uncharacterized protein VTP21DRAFT_11522 [Calcarisporiella thermophila]|uniref:uncharacterized protein n=1 Tax=Calcarisporiella thermophila TaxID=911321 RepID=UPI003742E59A
MATTRSLSDQEVFNEMKKMVAFIKQEALEKAREIKVKADEEFNIEKAKLVRQEAINIEAQYERKIKQTEVQKRIEQSNLVNKSRLRVLQAREQVLGDLFDSARDKLQQISKDKKKYEQLLANLIQQGAYKLLDEDIVVICRKSDVSVVETAIKNVVKSYKETVKKDVSITINKEENLPASSSGGVIVTGHNGRITIDNTLDSRLALCEDKMLPEIRRMLFGFSPNRKFFN